MSIVARSANQPGPVEIWRWFRPTPVVAGALTAGAVSAWLIVVDPLLLAAAVLLIACFRPAGALLLLILSYQLPVATKPFQLMALGPVDLTMSDVFWAAVLMHVAVLVVRTRFLVLGRTGRALLLFIMWLCVSQVVSGFWYEDGRFSDSLAAFARVVTYLAIPILVCNIVRTRRLAIVVIGILVSLPLMHLAWSVVIYVFPPDLPGAFRDAFMPDKFVRYFPINGFQAIGFYGAPYPLANAANVAAALLLASLPLARHRVWLLPLVGAVLMALVFTKVRTEWMGFVVAAAAIVALTHNRGIFRLPIMALGALGGVLGGPTVFRRVAEEFKGFSAVAEGATSFGDRLNVWEDAASVIARYPLGVGAFGITVFGSYGAPTAHSLYAEVAVDFGLPGLILLVVFLGTALKETLGATSSPDRYMRWLSISTAATVLALLVSGLTGVILLVGSATHMLILLGIFLSAKCVPDLLPRPSHGLAVL